MAYYHITDFASVALVSDPNRTMVEMVETADAVVRMGLLENGAIYDADGTDNADTRLGQIRARYKITPSTTGMSGLNSHMTTIAPILGRRGTLTGKQYTAGATVTKTCTARCLSVVEENYAVRQNPPLAANSRTQSFVVVTWQKLTEWA